MKNNITFTISISILGAVSSLVGGVLGAIICINQKSFIAFLYQITAGMMIGIVCFEMLPESFNNANIIYSIIRYWYRSFFNTSFRLYN